MVQYSRQFQEGMDFRLSDQKWLKDNYSVPAEAIIAKWSEMLGQLDGRASYSQVTDAEKRGIVKALMGGFRRIQTREKFFQCPNGHVCANTECGDTTEGSRCPECNSTIEGALHNSNASSSRATDL
ncbi:hypothetical protein M407DRAFT_32344 [Tulasnella calospora MUT 4182]|uniref:RZ-type domain-containing protein n=1 Tax=Tulasnella calospora MUT 4182 TaxID=1051891 RepID=A0A0C3L939_9AGAM|nr:hypothetical protein M407DRAFT_32344 [Tulasnella calospora MUT 4182]